MQIYYTTKNIFWCNGGNDYLENDQFNQYLSASAWTKLSDNKSINWENHYSASYYATKTFNATYFKIVTGGHEYYFFVDTITNDTKDGRFFSLSLDIYNTYSRHIIERFKTENPLVLFKRKHMNRFDYSGNKRVIDVNKFYYLFNIPEYLLEYAKHAQPVKKINLSSVSYDKGSVKELFPSKTDPIRDDIRTYSPSSYFDTKHKCYWYLKVKRPQIMDKLVDKGKNYSPYFYFPIKWNTSSGDNSWADAAKWPSDYVVDLISTSVSPDAFEYGTELKLVYGTAETTISFFKNSTSLILTPTYFNYNEITISSLNPLGDLSELTFKDEYNINNYTGELALYFAPFYKVVINDTIPLSTQYLIQGNIFKSVYVKLYRRIGADIVYYFVYDYNSSYPITPYNYNSTRYCFSDVQQHPYASNVLNEYINNNVNSWNTSVSLAKQQQKIDTYSALANGIFGTMMGQTTQGFGKQLMGYGLEVMNESTRTFGPGLISAYYDFPKNYYLHGFNTWAQGMYSNISGKQQQGNSLITMVSNIVQSKFNTKSIISRIKSSVADVANKPPEISDTYSLSTYSLFNGTPLFATVEDIPTSIKKIVFEDFYFNGYLVNAPYNFKTYDNRLNFNYFEMCNTFQYASKWFNYPKAILVDACSVIENGIRLWKTTDVKFDMSLNNQENLNRR